MLIELVLMAGKSKLSEIETIIESKHHKLKVETFFKSINQPLGSERLQQQWPSSPQHHTYCCEFVDA
jgi:hypothetical protein